MKNLANLRPYPIKPYPILYMAVGQNLVPLVNIKIAGKWMFIPLKMVLIGIDPYPYTYIYITGWWFLTILKNMSSSMGRIIPYLMENKIHV